MVMISKWNLWYDIEIKSWNFFEAGEVKSLVYTHHATISQAFTRYVRIGKIIDKKWKIEKAIKNLAGTTIFYMKPNRELMLTYNFNNKNNQLRSNKKFLKSIRS